MDIEALCEALNEVEDKKGIHGLLCKRLELSEFYGVHELFVKDCGTESLLGFLNDCLRIAGDGRIIWITVDDEGRMVKAEARPPS